MPSFPACAQTVAAPPLAEDTAAKIELLQSQVDALQAQINSMKSGVKAAAPNWKGAPEFAAERHWRFKLKGLLQFDAGIVENRAW